MPMPSDQSPILVLGASGKTGRRVVKRLRARELPVRLGSRWADPPFDWGDPDKWRPALEGARAVYVSYFPDLAVPGAPEAVGALAAAAVETGADRLVLISGRGEQEAQRSEEVLQRSGATWTVVRSSFFNQNFSESHFREPLVAGELALPTRDVGEPFIDAGDIADVAVAALTEDGHAGEVYEVTGPRLLTFAGRWRRSPARRAASCATCRSASMTSPPAWLRPALRRRRSRFCATCWPRSSTAGTRTSRTASNGRSGGRRGTSPTTRARPPRAACGTRHRCGADAPTGRVVLWFVRPGLAVLRNAQG